MAAIAEVIERHQASLTQLQSPDLLRELTASVAKLNRLLEDAVASGRSEDMPPMPAAIPIDRPVAGEGPSRPRALLTLKAVSKRTGIPAAMLRTWERRYRFTRPMRSSQGYRLYTEEDVTRILQVKHLLEQVSAWARPRRLWSRQRVTMTPFADIRLLEATRPPTAGSYRLVPVP